MTIFPEQQLTPTQLEINRYLQHLDQIAIGYEAKWGVGRLPEIVSHALAEKWEAQKEKFNAAVLDNDLEQVIVHSAAMQRGWKALEQDAQSRGHAPIEPDAWHVRLEDGFELKITKNRYDAQSECTKQQGCAVFTLTEIARLVQSQYRDVYGVKQTFPDATITEINQFDFEKGDDIPL